MYSIHFFDDFLLKLSLTSFHKHNRKLKLNGPYSFIFVLLGFLLKRSSANNQFSLEISDHYYDRMLLLIPITDIFYIRIRQIKTNIPDIFDTLQKHYYLLVKLLLSIQKALLDTNRPFSGLPEWII